MRVSRLTNKERLKNMKGTKYFREIKLPVGEPDLCHRKIEFEDEVRYVVRCLVDDELLSDSCLILIIKDINPSDSEKEFWKKIDSHELYMLVSPFIDRMNRKIYYGLDREIKSVIQSMNDDDNGILIDCRYNDGKKQAELRYAIIPRGIRA